MATDKVIAHDATARARLMLAMSLEPKEIGRRIAAARELQGWAQMNLAVEAHVSLSTVTRWESGRLPPVRELVRVARVLQVAPEFLVEGDVPATPGSSADDAVWQELRALRALLEERLPRAG